MNKSYNFFINDRKFTVNFDLVFANKIGTKISTELYNSGEYFVQSKVTDQIFEIFLNFLIGKTDYPEVDANDYYDFLILSNEFNNVLYNYLSKKEFDNICKESYIKKAKLEDNVDKHLIEDYIASNLDYYLAFYAKEMSEIPCTTLYNIFQHKNRVLNNQERAYQFLKQIFEGTKSGFHNEKSICILFETLDSTKIDEESLKESIEKRQERFGFAPIMNSSYFTEYRESFQNLMKLQQETLMIMKQQQELNAKKQNEMMIEIKTISQSIKTIENKID